MTRKRGRGRPYLVFAGTGTWLIESAGSIDKAFDAWFDKYGNAHGWRVKPARCDVRIRRLRLEDERWVSASFAEGEQVRLRKKFAEAFDTLREREQRSKRAA